MNVMLSVLAFLVALGPLIAFHELGHYWVARWCGVKVLRFSLGMGKVVWSRRFGPDQTEWAVSVLPLGGYVKMLDSRDGAPISDADASREFTRQSVWRRIAIVAAGPLANFLLAIAVFAGLFMYGIAEPGTRVGDVGEQSIAFGAGPRSGDQITAVNGNAVVLWSELRWQLIQVAVDRGEVRLGYLRENGERGLALIAPGALSRLDLDGDMLRQIGLTLAPPKALLGKVADGGAAQRAGLRTGDLIVSVDTLPVRRWSELVDVVRRSPGKLLSVGVLRDGQDLMLTLTPEADGSGKVGRIMVEVALPDMVRVAASPGFAVVKALRKTWDTSVLTVRMIGKMIIGEVSLKNVTGPITIADYAGQTARIGVVSFLSFVAFISLSLGVMNLLPIPVLDGGLLLYYSLEVLTGRPLPDRIGDMAQRVGVGLLVALMALAVFNDLMRLL